MGRIVHRSPCHLRKAPNGKAQPTEPSEYVIVNLPFLAHFQENSPTWCGRYVNKITFTSALWISNTNNPPLLAETPFALQGTPASALCGRPATDPRPGWP